MKTVFTIPPAAGENESLHLLTEVSADNISFLFYTKEPFKAEGLWLVELDSSLHAAQQAEAITAIAKDKLLADKSFSSTTILYNVKEATLVPKEFHQPMVKNEVLALLFGSNKQAIVADENIRGKEMVNIYRVNKIVSETLRENFPFSNAYHTNTLLLPQLAGDLLYVVVDQKNIRVVLEKEGAVLIAQQFSYQTAADVVYHLLNVAAQHNTAAADISLVLSGMIDETSGLYKELYKYFLNISFASIPENAETAEGFAEHPPHFFQHLILLASCV